MRVDVIVDEYLFVGVVIGGLVLLVWLFWFSGGCCFVG